MQGRLGRFLAARPLVFKVNDEFVTLSEMCKSNLPRPRPVSVRNQASTVAFILLAWRRVFAIVWVIAQCEWSAVVWAIIVCSTAYGGHSGLL